MTHPHSEVPSSDAGRPKFTLGYPRTNELDTLVRYFSRGNFRAVRTGADRLLAGNSTPDVVAAAQDLRSRLAPDRVVYDLLAITAILLTVLTVWAIRQRRDHVRRPTVESVVR